MLGWILGLVVMISACSDSNFADSGRTTKAPAEDEKEQNPKTSSPTAPETPGSSGEDANEENEDPAAENEKCQESKVTAIKRITKSITNRSANQKVVYHLGLEGCEEGVLEGATIRTDVEAQVSPLDPLKYEIRSAEGEVLGSGQFAAVNEGKDLFGNVGNEFRYWESKPLDIEIKEGYVVLELDYSNREYWPLDEAIPTPLEDTEIKSYFSISNTDPVESSLPVLAP